MLVTDFYKGKAKKAGKAASNKKPARPGKRRGAAKPRQGRNNKRATA